VDGVEDEASVMNVGQQEEHSFMHLTMGHNQVSAWTDYPDHYKFYSVHFHLNDDIIFTERATYDLLDLISDIGGTYEFLGTLFGLFTYQFANMRLSALMTNRLYHVIDETVCLMDPGCQTDNISKND
jgi:hypothetical protein